MLEPWQRLADMTDTTITLERIDDLLAFFPALREPHGDLEPDWAGVMLRLLLRLAEFRESFVR